MIGSTDNTIKIIDNYVTNGKCQLIVNKNVGAANSFLELIKCAPDADFYAFSDQDDVWLPNKLIEGISKIMNKKIPALYHSLAFRVDKNLEPLNNIKYIPLDTFESSLLSSSTGCTMVFNNELMKFLKKYIPQKISMHDAWVYRVCFALKGFVYYDTNSYILYRQHESNVSGGEMNFINKFKRQFFINKNLRLNTAIEIKKGFYEYLPLENQYVLDIFTSYNKSLKSKIIILCNNKYKAKKIKTTILYKILFLFNFI